MTCMNKDCKVRSDTDTLISCWLCDGLIHVKCVGLYARVADNLSDDKGLRWCCLGCRKLDVEFYKFFRSMKSEFSNMEKELSALSGRFSNFIGMFNKYPGLEKIAGSPKASSPKKKKTTKKSPPLLVIPSSQNLIDVNSPAPSANAVQSSAPSTFADVVSLASMDGEESSRPGGDHAPRSSPRPRTLTVVPARKTVFVSRLAPDTTEEDIQFYISSKLVGEYSNASIQCFKLKSQFSEHRSSFKIIAPDDLFVKLVDSEFWPHRTFVREFEYRDSGRRDNFVRLPSGNRGAPKN